MLTKRTAIKTAKQFLAQCNKLPIKIDRAILFGSMVKGKVNDESDIDLALFSEQFTDNILTNLDLIGPINIHYPDIDVHTYPSDYYLQKDLMMEEIRKTGIEITV